MDEYQVTLLGSSHLTRNGQPVPITRRKQWGLLAYLLLTRRAHDRDTLAALLWPANSQREARADLRRELARLRSLLPGFLDVGRDQVTLNAAAIVTLDVWAFEEHLAAVAAHPHAPGATCPACRARLEAAAAHYAGDLLAGLALDGCPDFEEWLFFQQETLRRRLVEGLDQLASLATAAGDFAQAIPPLRRRLAIDPLDEPGHRHLIWLYIHTGQRLAALRQFAVCKEVLTRELQAAPEPETAELAAAIGALSPTPLARLRAPNQERHGGQPTTAGPRCYGREHQLDQLQTHLATACAGCGHVVFVSGEAGAGKTALLGEFARLALANHDRMIVACGCGTAPFGSDAPLLPVHDLLAGLAGDCIRGDTRLLPVDQLVERAQQCFPSFLHALVTAGPHLAGTLVAGDRLLAHASQAYLAGSPDLERLHALVETQHTVAHMPIGEPAAHGVLFAELEAVLAMLAAQHPLLLLLDNLHWADSATLNLVFHLGKRLGTLPILLVGAYRPDELTPDDSTGAPDHGPPGHHPLMALVQEFTRDFGPIQIDLDAISPPEQAGWLDSLLAGEACRLPVNLRDLLLAETGAHPLFAVELLALWRQQGWLCRSPDGMWVEQAPPQSGVVPPRCAAAIQRRLDRVGDDALRLLRASCLRPDDLTVPGLAAVLGWSERHVLEVLAGDLHHRRHLIVPVEDTDPLAPPAYRFANPMVRSYLYGELDSAERQWLAMAGDARRTGEGMPAGTLRGTFEGRTAARLEVRLVDDQDRTVQGYQPIYPLAPVTQPQGSAAMYHRWHFNYPILFVILALLLVLWATTYVALTSGFRISDLWQPVAQPAAVSVPVELAPGYQVPRDYYVQEKTYQAPPVVKFVQLAPGFKVPLDYITQEKTYHAPFAPATQFVELAPGFRVPLDYYLQEKTGHGLTPIYIDRPAR